MPLDAQAQAFANLLVSMPMPDWSTLDVAAYRSMLAAFPPLPTLDDELASVEDGSLDGPAGPLAVRVYRPHADGPLPVTVYFHGGGFVSGGLDTHDNICRRLANRSGSAVAAVAYRLAPEHRFPAAIDDALAAVHCLRARAEGLNFDASRMAVAGDSAGGNVAAVVAQLLRDDGFRLAHQLLFYPVTDSTCATASMQAWAQAPMLTGDMMRWFWRHYLPESSQGQDPRASPLRQSHLEGLPAATVITAECDPLCDEGWAYAQAMARAGVTVTQHHCLGQFHGFASMLGILGAATAAVDFGAAQLRHAFA